MMKYVSINTLRSRFQTISHNFDAKPACHLYQYDRILSKPSRKISIFCHQIQRYTSQVAAHTKTFCKPPVMISCSFRRHFMSLTNRCLQDSKLDFFQVNTKIPRDTLLYSYSRDKFYSLLSYFGVVQCAFWLYLAVFSYSNLRDTKGTLNSQTENGGKVSWWRRINLGENKYKNGIALLCLSVGYIIMSISLLYPLRTVNQIWLLKGGETVKLRTYAPFGRKRNLFAPLDNVSALQARADKGSQIALKLKGRWLFFLVDNKGTFYETKLFDNTVGLMRKF